MVWSVILEDESKNAITSLNKDFISKAIVDATINKEFKLIKYLDPYGDTVFNRLQIDDLILDLDRLQEIKHDKIVDEIKILALRCKFEPHTYLVFYGD